MHEYALTQRIVAIVNETALAHAAKRVNTVFLVVGENSCVLPDSLQMYYDMIARDTPASGARLALRLVKARMGCPACGETFVRPRFSFACPVCGALGQPTDFGNELYVERIELED